MNPAERFLRYGSYLVLGLLIVGVAGCPVSGVGGGANGGDAADNGSGGDGTTNGSGTTDGGAGGEDGGSGAGRMLYVSTAGDDSSDGLSADSALRTITRAAQLAGPGDTVAIMPGTYEEEVGMEGVGAASAPITFRAESEGVVLDGGGNLSIGLDCLECVNIVIEGLEIRDYADIGVRFVTSRDVTMRNLKVYRNGFAAQLTDVEGYGILADDSRNVLIEDNEVFENGPQPQVPDRWLGTGIDTFAITDSVIRNNNSHDNIGGGLLVEDSVNVLVEGNIITGNELDATVEEWWDGAIWVDGGRDITLLNNTITGNNGPGVEISDEDNQQPTGYVLQGNTIRENKFGLYVWNFGTVELPSEDILKLIDNTVSDNTDLEFWIVDWECPPDAPCEPPE